MPAPAPKLYARGTSRGIFLTYSRLGSCQGAQVNSPAALLAALTRRLCSGNRPWATLGLAEGLRMRWRALYERLGPFLCTAGGRCRQLGTGLWGEGRKRGDAAHSKGFASSCAGNVVAKRFECGAFRRFGGALVRGCGGKSVASRLSNGPAGGARVWREGRKRGDAAHSKGFASSCARSVVAKRFGVRRIPPLLALKSHPRSSSGPS